MKNYESIKIEVVDTLSSNTITTSGEVIFDEVDADIWSNAYETKD